MQKFTLREKVFAISLLISPFLIGYLVGSFFNYYVFGLGQRIIGIGFLILSLYCFGIGAGLSGDDKKKNEIVWRLGSLRIRRQGLLFYLVVALFSAGATTNGVVWLAD
jgi:hypothetical protein